MTYIFPGSQTKLDSFTLRMMEDVLKDHATVTDHGIGFCCEVAEQYRIRVKSHYSAVADEQADRGTNTSVDRPLTPRQASYINGLYGKCPKNLLSPEMREQADKVVRHEEISIADAKDLIDAMKSLVDATFVSAPQQRGGVRLITPKMVGFLRELLAKREHTETVDIEKLGSLPFTEASEMITRLKKAPYKADPKSARYVPEDGFYCVDGTYYKVVTSERTGNTTARVWDAEYERWEYVGQRPFKFIKAEHVLDAEAAAQFGQLFHRCVFCTKQLTRKESEDAGYGKDCAEKHNLPWG